LPIAAQTDAERRSASRLRGGDSPAIVFVVDDDDSVRDALSSLLRSVGRRVQTFASASEFLARPPADAPACVVLDIGLPDLSGLELQHVLGQRGDPLPIIFITGHGDVPMSVKAMKAGAIEFLSKPFLENDLLAAIEIAVARDAHQRERRAEIDGIRSRIAALSRREFEVIMLVVKGLLNKQAAAELGITEVTVKVHRHRAMEKLRASSLPEVVRMVERVLPTLSEPIPRG
jgi:RNA polymerase sigma factor (sigma-70 family)